MFKTMPIPEAAQQRHVEIIVDGRRLMAREGEILAVALLKAGVVPFRHTPVLGQPRAPLCLMGVCFDCLVEVNGMHSVQSCMVEVHGGMHVRLVNGAPEAKEYQ